MIVSELGQRVSSGHGALVVSGAASADHPRRWAQHRPTPRGWAHDRTRDFRLLLEECLPKGSGIDATIAANLVLSMLATLYHWYDPAGPVPPEQLSQQIEKLLGALFQR